MPSPQKLFLSHNLIQKPFLSAECLKKSNTILCPLSEIHLNNNSISYIEKKFLDELDKIWEKIKAVNFYDNPFYCDCHLKPFFEWFKNKTDAHKIQSLTQYKCLGPPNLRDRYISELELSDLDDCNPLMYADDMESSGAQVVLALFLILIAVAVVGIQTSIN